MKNLITAILLVAIAAGSSSCKKDLIGNGPVTTETRAVTGFSGINLQMNGNVFYKQDVNWKVEVTAKQSIHQLLETYVLNNTLLIKYRNGNTYDADESIRINVSGPGVDKFMLNTSGSIYSNSDINVTNLFVRSTGSGDIRLQKVTANNIDAESSQSGTVSATSGNTINESLKTDGSGKIHMAGVSARDVTALILGSGNIKAAASNHLYATIKGSGSVYFSGYPVITSHVYGSGRIIRF